EHRHNYFQDSFTVHDRSPLARQQQVYGGVSLGAVLSQWSRRIYDLLYSSHHVRWLRPYAKVSVSFGECDGPVLRDDERGRQRQTPACLGRSLVRCAGVHERNVHENAFVVAALAFTDGVGDAVLRGNFSTRVGEHWKWERMLLDGEVVVTAVLRRDGDEERPHPADFAMQIAPRFQLRDAIRAPASAEELDYQRAEREQIGGTDSLSGQRIGQRELGRGRANVQDPRLNTASEQFRTGALGDGETLGLNEGAGLLRDAIKFFL